MIRFHRPKITFPSTMMFQIVNSGEVVNGSFTKALEASFRKCYDVKYAIACANCTSGLQIAIKALDLGFSNSVELPAFTWYSTLYAVESNKCFPRFMDLNTKSFLADERYVEESKKVDLFIAVDVFGNKEKFNTKIPVIYDAAHGIGLSELGNRGIAEVVSLSFSKIVTGMQGGIILTNDNYLAETCSSYVRKYAKITEINAAASLQSFTDFPKIQKKRLRIIDDYRKYLKIKYREQFIPEETNYSIYSIFLDSKEERDKVVENLMKNKIEYKIYYEPLAKLPKTLYVYDRILALPVYEDMMEQVSYICEVINRSL
jgi:dTDP-4-amino-4,6-dideoxygalactose transaminase